MIIYDKERKTLVIPEGIGCDCGGSTDCTSAVTAAYQEGYREGYEDGVVADCGEAIAEAYESGVTYQKSLLSSTTITENGVYTNENGWNSVEVDVTNPIIWIEKRFSLESGDTSPWTVRPDHTTYMTEVIVTDNGYGQGKYDEGYQSGSTDGYSQGFEEGYLSGASTTDCASAITEAYQSGVTVGYEQGLNDCSGTSCDLEGIGYGVSDGWNGETVITINNPGVTANGWSAVTVYDNGYGTWKYNSGYTNGYADGLADCSGGTCNLESQGQVQLDGNWTGFTWLRPQQGYDGFESVVVADVGYGEANYTSGFTDGHTSGFTDGYNEAITANCGTAITEAYGNGYASGRTDGYNAGYEDGVLASCTGCQAAIDNAYESGITDGQGSIFSVEVVFTETNNSWSFEALYQPDVLIIDENGNSHQLNYQYSETPDLYRYNHSTDTGTGNTGFTITLQFAGYLNDGAKYIQPYELKIPMSNTNLFNNNLDGVSVKINGEVIHNWRTGIYGYMLDDWQFGGGAWNFTPIATVVSDTYYDNDHRLVTFYLQGEGPMPA